MTDEAEELLEACCELRDLRARFATEQARLIVSRDERLAAWYESLPTDARPAKARAGDVVRSLLRRRGCTDEDLALIGVSSATVRVVLDRAQRQPA